MNKFILKTEKISHSFLEEKRNLEVLRDVSFSVAPGEFFVIIGPSGCGKSTLLRILTGLTKPERGKLEFDPSEAKDNHAMVFQSFAVFPWLTVEENIAFGLRMKGGKSYKEQKEIVKFYLEDLGLIGFANHYPRELSGGMRQRVGLARALVMDPEILFMDEPFSQLDAFTAERLRSEVLKIWAREKMTVVMVTHLIQEAVELADKILVMTPSPGRVEAIIENNLPRPRNERTPAFWTLEDKLAEIIKF